MDWLGGVLLGLSLVALLGSVSQGNHGGWTSPALLGGVAAAAVLFAVRVRVELRSEHPLVDLRAVASVTVAPQYAAGITLGLVFSWAVLWSFLASFALVGPGCGLALGALPTLVVEASAADRAGSASEVFNNLKTLGGSVGGAAAAGSLGYFLYFLAAGTGEPLLTAYQGVWAGVALLALGTAFLAGRTPRALR